MSDEIPSVMSDEIPMVMFTWGKHINQRGKTCNTTDKQMFMCKGSWPGGSCGLKYIGVPCCFQLIFVLSNILPF